MTLIDTFGLDTARSSTDLLLRMQSSSSLGDSSTSDSDNRSMRSVQTTSTTTSDIIPNEKHLPSASMISSSKAFSSLRLNYVLVTMVIMLADGLQGTHLYVLYDGYGFSVASLYALGFVAGAITTPITGPLIDKFGRKKSALLYCILEIWINMLEQYPILLGLIVSRVVGGVTTNLLSSVFETWLDTEYRMRGLDSRKYEIIMRDSVVVSNVSAIASGYLAHILAERYGAVGPFRGAVTCTAVALVVVFALWNENFGDNVPPAVSDNEAGAEEGKNKSAVEGDGSSSFVSMPYQSKKGLQEFIQDAVSICSSDRRVLRVGIIQGLTAGSLQTFVFLWSPTLQSFAKSASPSTALGLDDAREPAYGLIFGAYMAAGVLGGFLSPILRKVLESSFSSSESIDDKSIPRSTCSDDNQEPETKVGKPQNDSGCPSTGVEIQAACCYLLCAVLLFVPCMISSTGELSFSISLTSFLLYELLIGVMMPCEGVIRSIYLPSTARATMMSLPRIIVNVAVACGVIMTRSITTQSAFGIVSFLMLTAAGLQFSLVPQQNWNCIFGKHIHRTISYETLLQPPTTKRRLSDSIPSLADSLSFCDISTSDHDDEGVEENTEEVVQKSKLD